MVAWHRCGDCLLQPISSTHVLYLDAKPLSCNIAHRVDKISEGRSAIHVAKIEAITVQKLGGIHDLAHLRSFPAGVCRIVPV